MAGSSFFDRIRRRWEEQEDWPPHDVRDHWARIETYRRLYRNTKAELIRNSPNMEADQHKVEIFTPVSWPRELCRFSAALLFSESPKLTQQTVSDDVIGRFERVNDFGAFAIQGGEMAARDGRVAIRVIRDPAISADVPLLAPVDENQVIWDIRHGRFYAGGMVVIERRVKEDHPRRGDQADQVVYRLLEEHTAGLVTRNLYRGKERQLGKIVPLDSFREFEDLAPEEETGLDRPTLVPWQNLPSAESDLYGLEPLFKAVNEAESLMVDRGRKAIPRTFVDRSLADDTGRIQIDGYIFTGGSRMRTPLGTSPTQTIETVQPQLYSKEHILWIDHLTQLMVTCAGYAPLTWGIQGQTANVTRAVSGYALKLSQLRTLLTRAAKEHMALEALGWSVATALAWQARSGAVEDFLPSIELGDGLPNDPLDGAQEVLYLAQANAASLKERVKIVHPTWTPEEVEEEVQLIEEAATIAGAPGQGFGPIPATVRDLLKRRKGGTTLTDAGGGADPDSGVD